MKFDTKSIFFATIYKNVREELGGCLVIAQMPAGGTVRRAGFGRGQQQLKLFVEYDDSQPLNLVDREFIVVESGKTYSPGDKKHLVFIDTLINPGGHAIHVFEQVNN